MQHAEAISALSDILSDIRREGGSTESHLLKYANTHRLASTQLRKLAQVTNSARTLSFLDGNPTKRAAEFPLVDIDQLVLDYEEGDKVKSAATAQATVRLRTPNFYTFMEQGDNVKAASEEKEESKDPAYEEMETRARLRKHLDEHKDCVVECGEAAIVADEAHDSAKKAHSELVGRLLEVPFNEFEEDMTQMGEASTPAHVELLNKLASSLPDYVGYGVCARFSAATTTKRNVAWDRHNLLPLFKTASDAEQLQKDASAYCTHLREKAASLHDEMRSHDKGPTVEDLPSEALGGKVTVTGPGSSGAADSGLEGAEDTGTKATSKARPDGQPPRKSQNDVGDSNVYANPAGLLSPLFAPHVKYHKDKEKKENNGDSKTVDAIKELLSSTPGLERQMQTLHGEKAKDTGVLDSLFRSEAPKHRQRFIDEQHQSTRHVGALQRIMMTDPILRDADPDQVMGYYNDLAAVKPDIAETPHQLAFALREALQYGGVPSTSAKTLAELDKAQQVATKDRNFNNDAHYAK